MPCDRDAAIRSHSSSGHGTSELELLLFCGVVRDLPRSFTGRKIFPGLIRRNFFQFGESDLAHNTKMVMTNDLPNGAPQEFKDIVQLACLEVWVEIDA